MTEIEKSASNDPCPCLTEGPKWNEPSTGHYRSDRHYGEVYVGKCSRCSTRWLHYFYEHEAFTNSQRYYAGFLGDQAEPEPDEAVNVINRLNPRFYKRADGKGWRPMPGEGHAGF